MKKLLLQIILSLVIPAVSMATVVTKVGSGSVCPGTEIAIPITVTGLDGVSAISLSLGYDDTKITYLGHQNVNGNLSGTFMAHASGGYVYVSWYSTTPVNIGNDTLVWLRFEGIGGNTSLAWNTGNCEYADASGHPIASSYTNGSVNVYAVPSISSHPSNAMVAEGNNASFQISASGQGLTYQWQMKSSSGRTWTNLSNGASYSNVNSNRMTVNNVSLLMNGNQFRCVVIGTCQPGVISNPATLTVTHFIPTIVTQAVSCSSCPEEEFIIPVTVTNCNNVGAISLALGYDQNAVTYLGYQNQHVALSDGLIEINANNGVVYMTWASNGSTLNIGNDLLVELRFESQPSNHVFLWNANNCEYSDMSGNILPSSYTPGSVTVYYRPSINSNPVNRTIDEGSSTTFSISASGQGVVYQWQVSEDGGTTWMDCTNGTYYYNVSSSTLTVRNAPFSFDGNLYHCVASGTCPSPITSEPAMLSIRKFIPTIVTASGSVTTCENAGFSVPVTVTNCNDVGAISLALNYNSALMSFTGYENTHEQLDGGVVEINASEGVVYFTWASASHSLEIGDDKLVDLLFTSLSGNISLSWKTNYCEYSDPLGNILPTSFAGSNLTIYHAPVVTSNPCNQTIDEGIGTSFSVNATGQSLTFQWQCSEDNGATWFDLSNSNFYSNVTGRTLNVNNATVSMSGNLYRCVIGGYCEPETMSDFAMLTVMGVLPTIVTTIETTSSCPGVSFPVPVSVSNFSNVGAISLALSYDTTALTFDGYSELNAALSGGSLVVNANNGVVYASWMSVNGANIGDGHLISFNFTGITGTTALNWKPAFCEYSNLDGQVFPNTFRNGSVTISESMMITEQPQSLLAFEGQDVTFSVRANTYVSSYQWRLSQDGGITWSDLVVDNHHSDVTTQVLHVNNLDMSMNGNQYCCTVVDACQTLIVSGQATLTVDRNYTVLVSANPESYGSVSGGGVYNNGATATVTATPFTGFSFDNWTENGHVVSQNASYTFAVNGDKELTAHFSIQKINILANCDPSWGGTVAGTGSYNYGTSVVLTAIPAEGFAFYNFTEGGNVISTDPTIVFNAYSDRTLEAHFFAHLPELHMTGMSCSEFIAGQQATVSWTVQNDGEASTPEGEVWYDRVWLSVESRVAADDNSPILLGEFANVAALNPGEYYTQTQNFNIPLTLSGSYYLFVITDAYDCHTIYWEDDEVPMPFSPPPFLGALSAHCSGPNCGNGCGNRIYEQSEYENGDAPGGSYHDNFFFDYLTIDVPPLADLQVTSIIAPDDFYSGTTISATATIENKGGAVTNVSRWTDALYVSQSETFDATAIYLGSVQHNGFLAPEESYEISLSGTIPLTFYGQAYFYVYTDAYGQVYEHVANDNNICRSEEVNVILTPPADLIPTEMTIPVRVSTGQNLSVSYNVYNQGAGNPNVSSWRDKLFLSTNPDELTDPINLLVANHTNGLDPNATYTFSESVMLPSTIESGDYYVYVVVDADNQVFEYLNDDNNVMRSLTALTIVKPDLIVEQIQLESTVLTACYPASFCYTLKNAGEGLIDHIEITDKLFLSQEADMSSAILLNTQTHSIDLTAQQSISCNVSLQMPNMAEGTYYLFVLSDTENRLNESDEGNNSLPFYPIIIQHQPLPDLTPTSFIVSDEIQAGSTIEVEFDVANIGDLTLTNSSCAIEIFAVQNEEQILCPVHSQIEPAAGNFSIPANGSLHFKRMISVPANVTSSCNSFLLKVDEGNVVNELNENNNVISANVMVTNCPLPDLTVSNILVSETVQSGCPFIISFDVNNMGDAALEISQVPVAVYAVVGDVRILCPLQGQTEPSESENIYLGVFELVHFSQMVLLPPTVDHSCTQFVVMVDPDDIIIETHDDNNIATAIADVSDYPFDLSIQSVLFPIEVIAGESCSVSWTVKNVGSCPSENIPMYIVENGTYSQVLTENLPIPWVDKVYFSFDNIISDDDECVATRNRTTVLNPDNSYTLTVTFVMPYSVVGEPHLIVTTDCTEVTYDSNPNNNVMSQRVSVSLGDLPNLKITELVVDPVLTADQTYTISYTVTNEGEAPTTQTFWKDAFYIGVIENTIFGAYHLAENAHSGSLGAGESYNASVEVTIPSSISGNFYIIGFTDATSLVYEHDCENDNVLSAPATVSLPLPCDLITVNPSYPSSVVSGEEVTVTWTLFNIGNNPASGRVRDAIYLSEDNEWSSNDVMLGFVESVINLEANGQLDCQMTVTVQGVPQGEYYLVVRNNILHALNEASYDNNICVGLSQIGVGYPVLSIGSNVETTMSGNQYLYYKIEVGPEFEHQTLSCKLNTTSSYPGNGLYIAYEAAPTMSDFDFSANMPYEQDLEILIPSLEQGNYYILARGNAQDGEPQQVTLSADVINFEILHIIVDHGSNTGSLTTQVLGAKFDSIMDFRLVQGDDFSPAEKVFFSNATESFVTFDLTDLQAGFYDVEAELPGGVITIKDGAFIVEEGLPAELSVNVIAPSSVRSGNTFTVNIEYGNIGTTDLNVSGLAVVSQNGHYIALESDDLSLHQTELYFDTAEPNGNPDVLRPGTKATRTVFVKASNTNAIKIGVFAVRNTY